MSSGLYKELTDKGWLIKHDDANLDLAATNAAYKIIRPETIRYISYPYEWCFSQLKDAALTTLRIQLASLKSGMILKDASSYNIQFHNGRAVFIDTLSFDEYKEGSAWIAYRQFCQHFLAPLALMAYTDIRLHQLLKNYIDGIPLGLARKLLPYRTILNLSLLSHIHLHAEAQDRYAQSPADEIRSARKKINIGRKELIALTHSLASAIKKLNIKKTHSEWEGYYDATNYHESSMQHKEQIVADYITTINPSPKIIHDIGANNGRFSRIAATSATLVISHDLDHMAIENNYLKCKGNNETNILPLLLDLTNPSPSIGWNLSERDSFIHRTKGDATLALALIHHLAITNNVPLEMIAFFFSRITDWLIIEFIPKSDSQLDRLLAMREDIFPDYTLDGFETAFTKHFKIIKHTIINNSERSLFLLKRISGQK